MLRALGWAAAGVAGLAVLIGAAAVWPAVRLQMGLDRAVRSVALDWRDFGRQPAEDRLQVELARLGAQGARCGFLEADDGRAVQCAAEVKLGFGAATVPVRALGRIGADGDLQ